MRFSNKQLRQLIIPLFIEQILSVTSGLADSIMVASVGEAAMSGVSLVDTVMILLINIFSALATGGAVVAGQFIGQGNTGKATRAAEQLILFTTLLSLVTMVGIYMGQGFILQVVFGSIEQDVMSSARIYLNIVAVSIPFLALYNGCAAIFRSEGNSMIPMVTMIAMNIVNIVGNAIMIYGLKMGVAGAAIPTLISRIVAAAVVLIILCRPVWPIHLSKEMKWRFDGVMIKKILHIGVPNGLENSLFQLGKILVLSLVTMFGTTAIAANAVANTIVVFQCLPGIAMGFAILTVTAQCVGAEDYQQVKYYTKKLLLITYGAMWGMSILLFFLYPGMLHIYHLSEATAGLAMKILIYHGIVSMVIWPLSFVLPNTLRAADDVKFTMGISIASMWVFRIIFSYILGKYLGWGVFGVWVAMTSDWLFRSICFVTRYLKGAWQTKYEAS